MTTSRRARPRWTGLALRAAAAGLVTALPTAPADAATYTVSPGQDVGAAFERLRPGDTLLVAPGTYDIGSIRPTLTPGTSSSRITVTAQDPERPPLLQGAFYLDRPTNWTIDRLRFQGTVPLREAVTVIGGRFWSLQRSEFFGASNTGSFANVAISTWDNPASTRTCGVGAENPGGIPSPTVGECENPTSWLFTGNCVHHAGFGTAAGHTRSTDHNVYVNATGASPGTISRNIMYQAPAGSHVKVGYGGSKTVPGASGVTIERNTLHAAARSILVAGNVTGTTVRWNLLKRARPLPDDPTAGISAGVYVGGPGRPLAAGERPNHVVHNYGHDLARNLFVNNEVAPGTYEHADNPTYNTVATDPRFDASGCGGYHPANRDAARFGRFSS